MKKSLSAIIVALSLLALLAGCQPDADSSTSDSSGTESGTGTGTGSETGTTSTKSIKLCLFGADSTKTWNVWAWKDAASDVNYSTQSWPGGDIQFTKSENGYIYTSMTVDLSYPLGILFVSSDETAQTTDIIVPIDALKNTDTLYFIYGITTYYKTITEIAGIKSATVVSSDGNSVEAVIYGASSIAAADVKVVASDETTLTSTNVVLSGTTATITLSDGDIKKTPYSVTYGGTTVSASISTDVIDKAMVYKGTDLGVTLSGTTATFKMWAPTASKVELLLFADATAATSEPTAENVKNMTLGATGVWSLAGVDCTSLKYYKYRITNSLGTHAVCDIWSKAASADSVASQIVDINDGTSGVPSGSTETYDGTTTKYVNPWKGTNYTQAVVYEMHIRDWSRAFASDSTGKFDDITAALNATDGKFYAHLRDLGVTHVQIIPMFDYAQLNSDTAYNWGYNPYHYNVPEGRYVTDDNDGTDAVLQMRHMIQAFHDAGIAVNMDVVYNHTSGTGINSLYDLTVPTYFYRLSGTSYSNGSGCGNEIATNHAMVKKYVIDSLKHWMLDYHVNGFRFDLMGCTETATMKDIYSELSQIDPNVMVYGEPWTGGTSAVVDGTTKATIDNCWDNTTDNGVACFNDDFRNAIKGGEFGGFKKGQVQGTFDDDAILLGLLGSSKTNSSSSSAFTSRIGRSINYCECHDNFTLFDKLALSYLNKTAYSGDLFEALEKKAGLDTVKKQDQLCAAYMFLAQGTPFINGGQEFLRTKNGDSNSYKSTDSVNQIDLTMKDTYSDVYNTYKALIAIRKTYDAFTAGTNVTATTSATGVTVYVAEGTNGNFKVIFNASASDMSGIATGKVVTINESDGTFTVATEETTPIVGKKCFVILKTN